jgi:hypothetical protein
LAEPIRILLQTTIAPTEDDWHIGRFGLLRDYITFRLTRTKAQLGLLPTIQPRG